jgi:dolichol-phosphate mannosyltransferase
MNDPTADGMPELSIVLPAYQEEENLRLLLPRIHDSLARLGVRGEIVVVDTMTPLDATADLCRATGARYVPRAGGNTYGDAVRSGIAAVRAPLVVFMDADGSHPPEWIEKLHAFRDSHDVVIASRYVEQGFTENGATLVLMSRVLNWTYAFVLGIRCKDVSNSFRLYHTAQLKALTLRCNNFDIVEEILFKLVRHNRPLQIKEVPSTFKQRMFGKTKRNLLVFMATYIFTLIKLRFFV